MLKNMTQTTELSDSLLFYETTTTTEIQAGLNSTSLLNDGVSEGISDVCMSPLQQSVNATDTLQKTLEPVGNRSIIEELESLELISDDELNGNIRFKHRSTSLLGYVYLELLKVFDDSTKLLLGNEDANFAHDTQLDMAPINTFDYEHDMKNDDDDFENALSL